MLSAVKAWAWPLVKTGWAVRLKSLQRITVTALCYGLSTSIPHAKSLVIQKISLDSHN